MKKICMLLVLALTAAVLLCGCEDPQPTEPSQPSQPSQPTTAVYEVAVTDALGNPYTSGA